MALRAGDVLRVKPLQQAVGASIGAYYSDVIVIVDTANGYARFLTESGKIRSWNCQDILGIYEEG